jgi:two-component system chemotaxis response regulator CheY
MKMLLIDDDAVSRLALRNIFGPPLGWEVLEASDGQQALELLNAGVRPEFCVVDLQMPNMSGIEFLKQVRSDPYLEKCRVAVTSSSRDRATISQLAQLKVSGYLLKPYDAGKTRSTLMSLASPGLRVETGARKAAKYTLLAVDDDPVIRAAVTVILKSCPDWEVKFAVDGQDGFDCLYAGLRPDLVLTDLNMGNVDGVTLINRIRKDRNFAALNVAATTGSNYAANREKLSGLNVLSLLPKPVDAGQLQALLEQIATWRQKAAQ